MCETKNVKCSLRDLFQRWLAVELLQDWTELEWAMAEVAYSPSPSDRSKSLVGDAGDLVTPRPRSPSPSTSGIRLSARRSKRHHPNGSEERSPITEGPSPPPSAISLRSVPPPYSPSFSAPPNKRRRMSFDPAADSRSHRAVSPTGSLSGSAVPQYPQINEVHGSCSVSVAPAQSARSLPAYPPPGFSPALFSYDEDGQDSDRETNVPSPPATPAGSVAFEQIDDPAGDYQPPPDEDGSAGLLDSGQPVPPTDDLSGDTSSPSLDIEAISRFLNCYLPRPEHLVFDMEAPLKLELLRVNSLGQEWSQYADYVELVASSTAQFCFNLGRDLYNAQTELRSAQEDHRLVEGRLRARIRELEDDASRRDEEVDHLAAHGAELEATIRRLRAENEIDGLRERLDSALRTLQSEHPVFCVCVCRLKTTIISSQT